MLSLLRDLAPLALGALLAWSGAVKLAGQPRERCSFQIERAFGEESDCVNRRFFDWPEAAPGAVRAFDLRDRL